MCEPVSATTAVMMAVTAASAAYGMYATNEAAKDQEKANRKAQAVQDEQIQSQASVEANARIQQAREERARLRAASAESGVMGISITDLLDNVDMQAGTDVALISQNMNNRREASRVELGSRLAGIQQADWVGGSLNAGLQLTRQYQVDPNVVRRSRQDGP